MTLRAFSPSGRPIVATSDWIPATAPIRPERWSLEPDGALGFEFSDAGLEPCWDGVLTATRDGYTLFVDDRGEAWSEHELVLRELDDDGALVGEAIAFTPAIAAERVFDEGFERAALALLAAAEAVLDRWDRGDLAEAVRDLDAATAALRQIAPALRTPAPAPVLVHSPSHGDDR